MRLPPPLLRLLAYLSAPLRFRTLRVLATFLLSLSAIGQSPVIQAHLQPSTNILVGQPVRLAVTIYVPNYFTGEPAFPDFEIENAIVVLPQDRPEHSNTQISGVSYAGITETYVIYPQQEADFRLPPVKIPVPYASVPPKTTTVQLTLPALSFHAVVPGAARDLDYFLPTASLTIQQRWSAPLKNLRVGDSIERTITVTALRMQAMLIPPLPLDVPDGLRVYPNEPAVQDQKTDRGDFILGRRVQSARYFLRREGNYDLPAIEVKWWNLATNRLVTATLPPVHLSVLPNPSYVVELPPQQEPSGIVVPPRASLWRHYRSHIVAISFITVSALAMLWVVWLSTPVLIDLTRRWREERERSEARAFRLLRHASLHHDAPQTYVYLLRWLAVAYPGVTMHDVLAKAHDTAISQEVEKLGKALFAKDKAAAEWDGKKLATELRSVRRHHTFSIEDGRALQPLNPEMRPRSIL